MIKKNTKVKRARSSRMSLATLMLFGGGVLVLILILSSFFSMSRPGKDDPYIVELQRRIIALENALATREEQYQDSGQGGDLQGRIERMDTSWQRLDASLTLKTNLLAQRLDSMEIRLEDFNRKLARQPLISEEKSEVKKQDPPKPKVKKKKVNISKAQPNPRFHIVQKGDTAYSLSKAYGLTLQQLKDLNRFHENTTIYPGQKIRIDP